MNDKESPAICSMCGQRAVKRSSRSLPIEFREGTFDVEGFEYEHCDACGESFIDAAQMDQLQRAAVKTARVRLGRLSSTDIREMRLALGITQAGGLAGCLDRDGRPLGARRGAADPHCGQLLARAWCSS